MSGRVASSWPNLTKVGPSSSSISRSRRPRLRVLMRGVVGDGLLAAEGVAEAVAGGDLGDLAEAR